MRNIIKTSYQNFINFNSSKYKTVITLTIFALCINFLVVAFILIHFFVSENEFQDKCPTIPIDNPILTSGLVLYFRFNKQSIYGENRNFVCDLSGNSNNGKAHGVTWNAIGGKLEDGAFEFKGINDRITVKDADSLSPNTTGNFTVSFWVKFTDKDFLGEGSKRDYANFLGKGYVEKGYEWVFRQYNSSNSEARNNRISFYAFNKEGGLGAGSYFQEEMLEEDWIYITGVIDNGHVKIYKNGILWNTRPLSEYNITLENGKSDLFIGKMGIKNYFDGSIDELRIYNISLNNSQIMALYQSSMNWSNQ